MSEWLMLGFGLILTVGTGFFVASEFSLLNVERNDLESRQSRGEKGLSLPIRALRQTSTHLSAAQLGITITTLLTGFVAEPALTKLLSPLFGDLSISNDLKRTFSVILGMIIATVFSFLIGELVPKNMALSSPLKVLRFVVGFQVAFTWTFNFMIRFLNVTGNKIVRLLGFEPREELSSTRTAEELSSLVRRSASMGALDAQTATLLTKTLALSQLVAADVMTPRPRMHVLDKDANLTSLIEASIKTGHSRFPISDGSTDDIIGVAHVKQAAAVPREKREDVPVSAIMVEAPRVPETMRLETLMVELRAKGLQLAIVVDEYGGTAGLATLEDLVEELVGELADEHDRAKAGVTRGANSSVLFPGMTRPDELLEMAIKVPDDGAYETVAGFLMSVLGRIPAVGDEVQIEDGVLRVERMDGRRVDRVRFTPASDFEYSEANNE
jgi:CBS domain containing-hemolysin-like protein